MGMTAKLRHKHPKSPSLRWLAPPLATAHCSTKGHYLITFSNSYGRAHFAIQQEVQQNIDKKQDKTVQDKTYDSMVLSERPKASLFLDTAVMFL